MSGWRAGDLAVKITPAGESGIPKGAILRVLKVGLSTHGGHVGETLHFRETEHHPPGFWSTSFRKLQPASKKFTEMLRAIKPRVEA